MNPNQSASPSRIDPIILAATLASGVAGLAYQVVWHKYLAILMGAQARATVVVLALFLGGLSIGYFLYGTLCRKRPHQLWDLFALTEGALGFWAALFPFLFQFAFSASTAGYLPDWLAATLLILPPTIFMGGTLPLLTQALSRGKQDSSQIHTWVYAWNTLGAAGGALAAGYLLIPSLGLRGTLSVGAVLNWAVGAVAYFHLKKTLGLNATSPAGASETVAGFSATQKRLLTIGFISGFCLIALETIFIRYLAMAIGAAHYNFTLTVFLFVLGLGAGALTLKTEGLLPKDLSYNLLFSGLAFAFVYLTIPYWPYLHYLLRIQFEGSVTEYWLYQMVLAMGYSLILAAPLFLAGRTLPLCFHFMRDHDELTGYRVGQLYAVNTLGCVLGGILGGYVMLSVFNLDGVYRTLLFFFGAAFSLSLFSWSVPWKPNRRYAAVAAGLGFAFVLPAISPHHFLQPFRFVTPVENMPSGRDAFTQFLNQGFTFLHHKDDPDATVAITKLEEQGKEISRTIFVNGKSDSDTQGDLLTTLMLGHLPQLLAPETARTAIIGFGTGVTVGAVASHADVKKIDVVEISRTIVEQAPLFSHYTNGATKDPRVSLHQTDAFKFFQRSEAPYDVIISEPSNPYVTGVENLYTREFYRMARKALAPKGIFVQWIHTYALNDELFAMILRTLQGSFSEVRVFQLRDGDVAIVASREPIAQGNLALARARISAATVLESLRPLGITRVETLLAMEVLTPTLVNAIARSGKRVQTLEHPTLNFEAAQARFQRTQADPTHIRRVVARESVPRDGLLRGELQGDRVTQLHWREFKTVFCDNVASRQRRLCEEVFVLGALLSPDEKWDAELVRSLSKLDLVPLQRLRKAPQGQFTRAEKVQLDLALRWMRQYQGELAQFPREEGLKWFESCVRNTSAKDPLRGECLFHMVLFEDERGVKKGDLRNHAEKYLSWFSQFPKNDENYSTFVAAKDTIQNWLR